MWSLSNIQAAFEAHLPDMLAEFADADLTDKVLLRKRAIIETIIDQRLNVSQIKHTRHRGPVNLMVNLVCGLIAYSHRHKKSALKLKRLHWIAA